MDFYWMIKIKLTQLTQLIKPPKLTQPIRRIQLILLTRTPTMVQMVVDSLILMVKTTQMGHRGSVQVTWWSHKIKNIHPLDLILAERCDLAYAETKQIQV